MKPGNLVRIIPKDTIGLIVKARPHEPSVDDWRTYTLFHVQLVTDTKLSGQARRYLAKDLRKIS